MHDFLLPEESKLKKRKLRLRMLTSFFAMIAFVVLAIVANANERTLGFLNFLFVPTAWLFLLYCIGTGVISLQYEYASTKQLESLLKMLKGNDIALDIARTWTKIRPLQVRDVKFLIRHMKDLDQQEENDSFAKSLNELSGGKSDKLQMR